MKRNLVKALVYLGLACLCLSAGVAFAEVGIDAVATNISNTFVSFAKLLTAASYLAGLGFAVGAILKFKAHKDNPQQVPISMPITLLFVAVALVFIPGLLKSVGTSVFGDTTASQGSLGGFEKI